MKRTQIIISATVCTLFSLSGLLLYETPNYNNPIGSWILVVTTLIILGGGAMVLSHSQVRTPTVPLIFFTLIGLNAWIAYQFNQFHSHPETIFQTEFSFDSKVKHVFILLNLPLLAGMTFFRLNPSLLILSGLLTGFYYSGLVNQWKHYNYAKKLSITLCLTSLYAYNLWLLYHYYQYVDR